VTSRCDKTSAFRFYAELNDFLPADSVGREIAYQFGGAPSVKEAIEAQGIPHTEVDLILANGVSVGFDYRLHAGDRIAVYPVFETFDLTPLVRVRRAPLRAVRFVLDVNLGRLARWLRLLGFDAVYRHDFQDAAVACLAGRQNRVVLTRDRLLLHRKAITHGYWVRSDDPVAQVAEVLRRFQLERNVRPFRRCLACNGLIHPATKAEVLDQLEPGTRTHYEKFYQCDRCGKVYWHGPHHKHMLAQLQRLGCLSTSCGGSRARPCASPPAATGTPPRSARR